MDIRLLCLLYVVQLRPLRIDDHMFREVLLLARVCACVRAYVRARVCVRALVCLCVCAHVCV
jgi:hypothetical protein